MLLVHTSELLTCSFEELWSLGISPECFHVLSSCTIFRACACDIIDILRFLCLFLELWCCDEDFASVWSFRMVRFNYFMTCIAVYLHVLKTHAIHRISEQTQIFWMVVFWSSKLNLTFLWTLGSFSLLNQINVKFLFDFWSNNKFWLCIFHLEN